MTTEELPMSSVEPWLLINTGEEEYLIDPVKGDIWIKWKTPYGKNW